MARIDEVSRNELLDDVRARPPYVPKPRDISRDTEEFLYAIAGELQHLIQIEANETPPRNKLFWVMAKDGFNNEPFDILFQFAVDYFEVLYYQNSGSSSKVIKQVVDDACAFACAHIVKANRELYNDADRETLDSVRDLLDDEDDVLNQIDRFKRRNSRDGRGGRDRGRDDRDYRGGRDRDDRDRGGRSYSREYDSGGRDRDYRGGRDRGRDDRGRDDRGRNVSRPTRSTRNETSWRTSPSAIAEREVKQDDNFKPKIITRQPMGEQRTPSKTVAEVAPQANARNVGTPVNSEITFMQVLKDERDLWPALPRNYIHPAWDGSRFLSYFNTNNNSGRTIPVYLNISECNMDFKTHNNEVWLTTRREEIRNRPTNYGNVDKKLRDATEMKELDRMLADLRADTVVETDAIIADVAVRLPRPISLNATVGNYHSPIDAYDADATVDLSTSSVAYVGVKFNSWDFNDNDLVTSAVKVAGSRDWEEVVSRLMRLKALLVPYCWEQLEYDITCRYNQLLMTGFGLLVTVDSFTEDYKSIDEMLHLEYPELVAAYQTLFFEKFLKVALTYDNTALAISAGIVVDENARLITNVCVENVLLLPMYSSDLTIRGVNDLVALNRQSHAALYECLNHELEYLHEQANYIKIVLLDRVEFYAYSPLLTEGVIYMSNKPITTTCLIDVIEG